MKPLKFTSLILAPLLLATTSPECGHARMVRRDTEGGILALQGDRSDAMRDARRQMDRQCNGPFTIVAEENVPLGSSSTSRTDKYGVTHTTSSAEMETQLTYKCEHVKPATPASVGSTQQGQQASPARTSEGQSKIKCASCGSVVPARKFCAACGKPLPATHGCGATIPAGARFCPICGMAVSPAP